MVKTGQQDRHDYDVIAGWVRDGALGGELAIQPQRRARSSRSFPTWRSPTAGSTMLRQMSLL